MMIGKNRNEDDKIGINISKLRIERGITQEQLGRDIGLTASAISNIECAGVCHQWILCADFLSCLGLR